MMSVHKRMAKRQQSTKSKVWKTSKLSMESKMSKVSKVSKVSATNLLMGLSASAVWCYDELVVESARRHPRRSLDVVSSSKCRRWLPECR